MAKKSKETRRFRRKFNPKDPKKITAASFETLSEYPPRGKTELLKTIDANKETPITIRNQKGSLKNTL